ncbi:MAG TPA: cytochrome c-type biogenesis CcmF C-terminal domain-containing protein [Anaerolineales bacterium]|jgi:cytochrome c-type biogenesis protein CcmF|nr:cytochrome c-type biogenesis CcmF C-terminal domain-containing protein [Anaerolineales bacterium]
MIANFGSGVLFITFLVTLYSVFAAIYGERKQIPALVESARRAMLLTWPLLTLTSLILIYLLVNDHYEVQFVYEVTSRSMPIYLKVTAWWGGQAGSLLFWSWLMAAFASLVTLRKWERDREFLPWVIVVACITLAFFIGMNLFFESPFKQFYQTFNGVAAYSFKPADGVLFRPEDGNGLNPLLRHPGMIIHPPMLYLGFVSFVIPYAFAIAALITNRTDDRWIRLTRRWTLWAWLFLSFGLVLGGRWAYDVLGWGGYWGWDPVEIAAFMPWLTGTAFLHSVMIQEKRGMLKHWNMLLIVLTYALVIFGTFLTRSGVLSSVHAFAQSAIGPLFFGFIALTLIVSVALILHRWSSLKSETEMTSLLSREALFLLNNLLFMSILVVCFWGVIFPLISELFSGQKVTVGPPFYERATSPLFGALMLLMGVAPLSAWAHSTVKTLGRALWKPTLAAVAITVTLFFTYTQKIGALIGFFLIAFVILVTLYEYWRGAYARQRSQGENVFTALWNLTRRNRRRYGGYIIHLSMMLMAIGILGIEMFQRETQGTLKHGETISLANYELTYREIAQWDDLPSGVNYRRAVLDVYENGEYLGQIAPRIDYYYDSEQNMTIPGQRSTFRDDLYVLLVDWEPVGESGATFKIFVNPLVNWLWLGSFLFLAGIVIAAWPEKETERAAVTAGARLPQKQTSAAD